jgi:hypothetical protein
MSEIKVNKISPKQTCTQLTLGDSGDTIIIPAGATIQNSGTATGFGRTGSVNWDTTPKTTTVTAVSGVGYFINTTSGAITVNLPAGTAGDIVAVSDYANTAATNKIVIAPNGSQKIQGANSNYEIKVNGGTVTLVYVDSTQGWRPTDAATASSITEQALFVAATGGCVATCGNYKIHTFTGPGTFTVSSGGNSVGSNSVDYLVIAGGGGGGRQGSGGGGAGGYRESKATGAPWTASPLATSTSLPVIATAYPITVGAGGAGGSPGDATGSSGINSIFSTITSAGGGGGASRSSPAPIQATGIAGGSGGGGAGACTGATLPGGAGNTPPVAPPQGNTGGSSTGPSGTHSGGGGGGAGAVGSNSPAQNNVPAGPGGAGVSSSITGSSVTRAGGGGGSGRASPGNSPGGTGGPGGGGQGTNPGDAVSGTANTGGGGGGAEFLGPSGGSGGSGIVVIRYKFQ